ncbi:MAG: PilZ domain-containing protein [Thermodesulfobacteriota bacterium]
MDTAPNNAHIDKIEVNDQSLLYCPDGSGEVVDISMEGLSFRRLTGNNWPQGTFKIDLLLENSTLLIEQIPCSLINSEAVISDDAGHCRYALEFGALSAEQTEKLQEFIASQREQRATLTMI